MDDEPHVRDAVQRMITTLGHTTTAVADGPAAVAAFAQARDAGTPFDLVLLDLTIAGGLGGRAVVTRLREITPDLRSVAMSGYSEDPSMSEPRTHGFTTKLAKPCTIADLARVISDALGAEP
jgi:CheY-like chemotaxis protein